MLNRFSGRFSQNASKASASVNASQPVEHVSETASSEVAPADPMLRKQRFLDAKLKLHRQLIEEINLSAIEKLPQHQLQKQVSELVAEYVLSDRLPLNAKELEDFS